MVWLYDLFAIGIVILGIYLICISIRNYVIIDKRNGGMFMRSFDVKTIIVDGNYGVEELYRDVTKDSSGVVLLRGSNAFIDALTAGAFDDRIGVFGHDGSCTVQIYPVYYTMRERDNANLTECRFTAVYNLYAIWCEFISDRKRNPKDCHKSKEFIEYRNRIEYTKADYVVFLVN